VERAELRELVARLRTARNSGAWHLEMELWAQLAEALKEDD